MKKLRVAAAALGLGVAAGLQKGMRSKDREPEGVVETKETEHQAIERQGASDLEAAARAFDHDRAYAQTISGSMTAAEAKRKGLHVPEFGDEPLAAPDGFDV